MAFNLTNSVASVISDTVPVGKFALRVLFSDLILAINGNNSRSARVYHSRADAVSQAASLDSLVSAVMTIEGSALVIRSRGATADDPLFATGDRWGATLRIDVSGTDGRSTPSYATRSAAEAAASSLPSAVNQILVREGTALVVRSRSATSDDPLYPTGSRWGVVQRQDSAVLREAIRAGAILTLTNIGGTGDAVTASISSEFTAAGITSLGGLSEVEYIPIATNSATNPTITVGGSTFGVRRADGSAWIAGRFVVGRIYKLRRFSNTLRVTSGDVQAAEIEAQIATLGRKFITVTASSSNADKNANNWTQTPGSYRFVGVPISNAPQILTSPHTGELQVEASVTGVWQTWRDASGRHFTRRRIDATWQPWIEIARESRVAALEERVDAKASNEHMTAALAAILLSEQTVAALTSRVFATVKQTTPAMPVRPNYPMVEWITYSAPPPEIMGAEDRYLLLPTPQPPAVPAGEVQLFNARTGSQVAVSVLGVPPLNPPIKAILYSVDGGGFTALTSVGKGDYLIPAPSGARQVTIRYRNTFDMDSVESLPINITVDALPIIPDMGGTGLLHALKPAKWRMISSDTNPDTRGIKLTGDGFIKASHTNARIRYRYLDYFVTNQRVRLDSVTINPASVNTVGVMISLNNNSDGTNAIEVVFNGTGFGIYRRTSNSSTTLLDSYSATWVYPMTVEAVRNGNNIQVYVDGQLIRTFALAEAHRLIGGTPGVGIMLPNGTGVALDSTRFKITQMGHL